MSNEDLGTRRAPLTAFLGATPLTQAIAQLEHAVDGSIAEDVPARLAQDDVTEGLLRAAFDARAEFGRINDLIHAAAIGLAPSTLDPLKRWCRSSKGAVWRLAEIPTLPVMNGQGGADESAADARA